MQSDRSGSANERIRLTHLRALVARLERLPASPGRDWMLQEARSRMVDVETGDEPRPMRTRDEKPPARSPRGPGSGAGRASSKAVPAPPPVPTLPRTAEPDASPATFGADGLLWLGEPVAEPDDGSTEIAPWKRGLRA